MCLCVSSASPLLSWRDVQHIIVKTSRAGHLSAPDWKTNAAGYNGTRTRTHTVHTNPVGDVNLLYKQKNCLLIIKRHRAEKICFGCLTEVRLSPAVFFSIENQIGSEIISIT